MIGGWVSKRKKRKASSGLPLPPPKKRATGDTTKPDSREICDSDADDEDDLVADENDGEEIRPGEGQQSTEGQDDGQRSGGHGDVASQASLSDVPGDPVVEHVVGSIEGATENVEAAPVLVIGSSHESTSS